MAAEKKVWLITGGSSGFGKELTLAALARGDVVVATARKADRLKEVADKGAVPLALDVLASDEDIASAIQSVLPATGGRIDILVNNAGYILSGGVEECSRSEVEATFQTNVFGQLNMVRAVLPIMRQQRSGVVANLGSIGSWHGTPGAGLYCATKACASILAESLRGEVAHLGIQVTAIEPGYFRTNFLGGGALRAKNVIDDLKPGVDPTLQALEAYNGKQPGDPVKGAKLIIEALTSSGSCEGRTLPPRLSIGKDAHGIVTQLLRDQQTSLDAWKELTTTTDCDDVKE